MWEKSQPMRGDLVDVKFALIGWDFDHMIWTKLGSKDRRPGIGMINSLDHGGQIGSDNGLVPSGSKPLP